MLVIITSSAATDMKITSYTEDYTTPAASIVGSTAFPWLMSIKGTACVCVGYHNHVFTMDVVWETRG